MNGQFSWGTAEPERLCIYPHRGHRVWFHVAFFELGSSKIGG